MARIERFISLKIPDTGRPSRVAPVPSERPAIRLSANENPYGCSPRVIEALTKYVHPNIYPDKRDLSRLLGEYVGISEEYIVPTSGASEIMDHIAHLFVGPGDEVIGCVPAFGLFEMRAQLYGGTVIRVPLDEDFAVNVAAIKGAITENTKIIDIVNPNNPTGALTPQEDILEIADTGLPVLVDEAYFEFCGETLAPFVSQYENIMLVRTLSKWAGLAGARIGYGIVPPKIAEYINKITLRFHINTFAVLAVRESLKDLDYLQGNVRAIIAERERLFSELSKLDFLKPYPSAANFICCSVLKGDARDILQKLENKGIRINAFDLGRGGVNALRITVGKPEHNDALIKALREIGGEIAN